MMLPQEIEVWYVLPAIRSEMCKELIGKGLTQRKTAALFGLTEAAVSQYLTNKRAGKVAFKAQFLTELKSVCEMIKEGKMTAYEGLQILCREFRQSGQICAIHRKLEKPGDMPCSCKRRLTEVCTK
jgi:predicted transcriptional regulator